jgi:probable F420-dependent oxidoreductase
VSEASVSEAAVIAREALGRLGIWMTPPARIGLDTRQYAAAVEKAGFRSLWIPGLRAGDEPEAVAELLSATERLIVGTGVLSIWHWTPAELAAATDRLTAAYPERFIPGLGVSHASMVEAAGQAYVRPLAKMRQFLDELPAVRAPVVLAALGPRMLELARDRTAGAHPYFSPPEHTAFARSVLGPAPLLIPEQAVSLAPGSAGRAAGRAYAALYLTLPNYTNNLRRFGFGDEDFTGGGSDRLISAIVPAGRDAGAAPLRPPQDAVAARIREHLDAGADHVVIQAVAESGGFAAGDLDALASAVEDLL